MYNIGSNIKALRIKKGWTQAAVSKYLKISIPAYSKIETNITDINYSRMTQIATLFDVTLEQLLTGEVDPTLTQLAMQLNECKTELSVAYAEIRSLQTRLIKLLDRHCHLDM